MNRKTVSFMLCLLAAGLVAQAADDKKAGPGKNSALDASSIALSSEYIEVAVDPSGNFTIGTRVGDPANPEDDNRQMLYGHPSPWSGATTLRIDGTDYWNYDNQSLGPIVAGPVTQHGFNSTVWEVGKIRLTQRLEIVSGSSSGRADTVLIEYTVQNLDSTAHQVGVRSFLDTWLGSTDGAPFRVPGIGDVTKEREAVGAAIPAYWQGFDDLLAPTMKSQGTLDGGRAVKPDRVVWGEWPSMNDSPWQYEIDPHEDLTNDSAVALYWNPVSLAPGASKRVATYYGLAAVDVDMRPPLALGVTAPAKLGVVDDAYSPNPFTVVAYVSNSLAGAVNAQGVFAEIVLPAGLELAANQTAKRQLGDLAVNASAQASWQVKANGAQTGSLQFTVKVGAANANTKSVFRTVFVPRLSGLLFPLAGFTPYDARVTAVFDNNGRAKGVVAYDGQIALGAKKRLPKGIVGYKSTTGLPFSFPYLNYDDAVAPEAENLYLFSENHNGYDYAPGGIGGMKVRAAEKGVLAVATRKKRPDARGNLWRNEQVCPAIGGASALTWNVNHAFYIIHADGYSTWYQHVADLEPDVKAQIVEKGYAEVERGQNVATAGGFRNVAPHLHFSVRHNGALVDPYGNGTPETILWATPPSE